VHIQTFYGDGSNTASRQRATWNKPRGVSNVYMLLIGAGATGTGSFGGGSGAVTVFYTSAQNTPDILYIWVGGAGRSTYISIDPPGSYYLHAPNAVGVTGGVAVSAPALAAQGFYQSIAGQNGSDASVSASGTTFLGGGCAPNQSQTSNYGYTAGTNRAGFFLMQPIIVGAGGSSSSKGGIGCGGGLDSGEGGPGLVLIASW